jgi:hypothetical protein
MVEGGSVSAKPGRILPFFSTYLTREIYRINKIKKASRRGGCTNQIPLTIKPYPMP